MEEILASIRKIIAEDPPGSRPVPEAPRESAPRAAQGRDPFAAAFASKPAAHAAASEPLKAADAFAGLGRSNAMGVLKTNGAETLAVENDFAPVPSREAPRQAAASQGPSVAQTNDSRTNPTSIEDQMADILGMSARWVDEQTKRDRIAPAAGDLPVAQASVQAALDSLSIPAAHTEPKMQSRPGFTVARDGYIPGGGDPFAAASAPKASASDPFEFALGPSPFARAKGPESVPGASTPAPTAGHEHADLGSVVPSRAMPGEPLVPFSANASPVAASASPILAPAKAFDPWALSSAPPATTLARPAEDRQSETKTEASQAQSQPAVGTVVQADLMAAAKDSRETVLAVEFVAPQTIVPQEVVVVAPAPFGSETLAAVAAAPEQTPGPAEVNITNEAKTPPSAAIEAAPFANQQTSAQTAIQLDDDETEEATVEIVRPAKSAAVVGAEGSAFSIIDGAGPTAPPVASADGLASGLADLTAKAAKALNSIDARSASLGNAATIEAVADTLDAHVEPSQSATMYDASAMSNSRALSRMTLGTETGMQTRTMEDTVAELLRPMLRSWLAENMPKIVERALRKELDDSNQSEHKTAAE